MSKQDELNAAIDAMGAAVVAELDQLKVALLGDGLTAEQVDAAIGRINLMTQQLKSDDTPG